VHDVLRMPGQPLDPETRAFMEPRFGYDFSHVRVHTDGKSAESARAVNAVAYTVGQDVVFSTGNFAPDNKQGKKLLAHELAHVVQQRHVTSLARFTISSPSSADERAADMAAAQVVTGQRVSSLNTASSSAIQRETATDKPSPKLSRLQSIVIDTVATTVTAGNQTLRGLLAATLRGLVLEAEAQVEAGKGERFLERVKELLKSPSQMLEFYLHYLWGLVKGIFSPITGLFDLAKLGVQLIGMQAHIMQAAWSQREVLAQEAGTIAQNFSALGGKAKKAISAFLDNPKETIKALSKWLDAQGSMIEQRAEAAGHSIGQAVFSSLEKPWSAIGDTVGEVIGTVLVNLALFIFTEGIGNAIVQIASKLGELGSVLSKMGKAAQLFATVIEEVSGLLGKAGAFIAQLEKALASVAETLLKPLQPVMEEFGQLLGSLRTFLRRLLGVSEEAATGATERLAAGAGKALEPHAPTAPKTAPKSTASTPQTAPKPVEQSPTLKSPSSKLEPGGPSPTVKETLPMPQKPGVLRDVSDDAARALEKNPALLEAYEKNPHAAAAMKFCQSPCVLPEFATPPQVQRVEKIMAEAEKRGIELNRKKLAELFNRPKNEAELERTIDELEKAFRRVRFEVPKSDAQKEVQALFDETQELASTQARTRGRGMASRSGTAERPTQVSTHPDALRASLEKNGIPVPPGHDPHHIVPSSGGGEAGMRARAVLERESIHLDTEPNGVPLPRTTLDPQTVPVWLTRHQTIHTNRYYETLANRLEAAPPGTVRDLLRTIRTEIAEGRFPH
jgi:hypothetical protein